MINSQQFVSKTKRLFQAPSIFFRAEEPTAVLVTEAPATTAVPQATVEPEATYTLEPIDQGGGGIVTGGNCANPYFPVADGAIYRYYNLPVSQSPNLFLPHQPNHKIQQIPIRPL